ncbi:ExsB family protein, partial [gut metagenome]
MLQVTNDSSRGESALLRFFDGGSRIALALSGGCDSAYLLALAVRAGCDVRPYFVKSDFQPEFELEDARRLCKELGVELTVLHVQPLADKQIVQNSPHRCYYCKRMLFSALVEVAQKDGCAVIWDGTNASDVEIDRPGMKALQELEVQSPLRICGLTKLQVREGSRRIGLF